MNRTILNAIAARKRSAAKTIIAIEPSPTADSRTADHPVDKEELLKSSQMHIADVGKGMDFFADLIREAGKKHDWTKITFIDAFHKQFSEAQRTGVWAAGAWFDQIHCKKERHHLEKEWPSDVNLIDVLEHIADCVMAGKARSGRFATDMISANLLEVAYINTQKILSDAVTVSGQDVDAGSCGSDVPTPPDSDPKSEQGSESKKEN